MPVDLVGICWFVEFVKEKSGVDGGGPRGHGRFPCGEMQRKKNFY